ncbi:hypothetical protein E2I00_000422, partial [Balaenoptera physalus]
KSGKTEFQGRDISEVMEKKFDGSNLVYNVVEEKVKQEEKKDKNSYKDFDARSRVIRCGICSYIFLLEKVTKGGSGNLLITLSLEITTVTGTLFPYPENWAAFKALSATQCSGAPVRVLTVPPHFHFGQTKHTPEFLHKFPAGKVPAFEGDDGFCVVESNAIAYHVSNEELRGSTPEAAAQVVQWRHSPPASIWVFPTLGIMRHNKQATENAKQEAFPNTNRWFLTCINQPQFRAVLGEFAESQLKKDTPRKEKASREEKQKPQAERKEEKKTTAPAPADELGECERAAAAEPEAEDAFARLPKSAFVLDEFKRKYSNEDTLRGAAHFDRDGWSLWYSEYRFPEGLTQTFMSCSLMTAEFQRLDNLRKNTFARVILFGTNNSGSISGVWFFRGQGLAFPLSPDWQGSYVSY